MTPKHGNHSGNSFVTQTGPEYCTFILPFFSLCIIQLSKNIFFQFNLSVPTQSVLCTVFTVLAGQGDVIEVIHPHCLTSFQQRFTSFRIMAVVLLVSAEIKRELNLMSLFACKRKDHRYPVIVLHNS